ncbi:MAG TPA: bifunctional tRNA (5-methylaminomethyl-2-thiouridine)(34)-methyltransferase MnmD/FAD-dependent 5-carboxymethylaminomethyl-2-thiouridine(34) oxidoreductase MnmC [Hyphomicrobiales bacterium]|nr:bifunctional tRNA (5-methylaminomethyl-2-thiouridine)(34)-methyltransferase MnmD/FAD-dependent 5-carboxymethylaminomethyl-2-thiouridine(34) oxidoreductase MnmC [Hyphomicrobiales bacterium]
MTATLLPSLHLSPATLQWDAAGLPHSSDYGDVYFSRADALGESSHVFLEGNALPQRFAALSATDTFVIGELGFGSGLNFLNTWRLWERLAPPNACLHYLACELHPLPRAALARLHAHWPALAPYSNALLAQYPEHTAGIHQLRLQGGTRPVMLTLLYGDARHLLAFLAKAGSFHVDAWYLDGFSPRLNPGLWQHELFAQLAALSTTRTTLASYSVAASVRQALQEAGFAVEKSPGFADKRHMLRGRYPGANSAPAPTKGRAAVVGGGLAGCATAFALAESGWQVDLFEREAQLALGASGNPQGILHFRPVKRHAPDSHFNLYAYLHASRYYGGLAAALGLQWHPCGHLQLANTPTLQARFQAVLAEGMYPAPLLQWLDRDQASACAGQALNHPALFFPDSGWLAPPALCRLYAAHPAITVRPLQEVRAFTRSSQGWQLTMQGAAETATFALVVLANSMEAGLFPELGHLPLISNRGQVDVYAATPSTHLDTVVCGQSYLVPGDDGVQCTGGSYFLGDESAPAQQARQAWHRAQLTDCSPTLGAALDASTPLQRRSASRCITPDRLPLVGALDSNRLPGLYLNLAHGSHGLTRTPLCAAWLASVINATPPPCLPPLGELLAPQRYAEHQAG